MYNYVYVYAKPEAVAKSAEHRLHMWMVGSWKIQCGSSNDLQIDAGQYLDGHSALIG